MFIQQKKNAIFRVSLTLDKVLIPFWNLSRNLLGEYLLRNRDYSEFDAEFEQVKLDHLKGAEDIYKKNRDSQLFSIKNLSLLPLQGLMKS